MRAVLQRVRRAAVCVDGNTVGAIGKGTVIFLGVKNGDTEVDAKYLAEKSCALRIFEDRNGKMNLSLADVGGSVLVISQFTLYGDARKGNRPSFVDAAPSEIAEPLYDEYTKHCRRILGDEKVDVGVFRAMMEVELINDGPVTFILESKG